MQFLRLGKEGYTKIMVNLAQVAKRLQKGIEDTGMGQAKNLTNNLTLVIMHWLGDSKQIGLTIDSAYIRLTTAGCNQLTFSCIAFRNATNALGIV